MEVPFDFLQDLFLYNLHSSSLNWAVERLENGVFMRKNYSPSKEVSTPIKPL